MSKPLTSYKSIMLDPRAISRKIATPNIEIFPNSLLIPMKLGKLVGIRARYRNARAYPISAFTQMTPGHPRWPMLAQQWQTRTDPLWWSATSSKDFAQHSTVRSWACRRVRNAMVESLRKGGWDRNGRPLEDGEKRLPLYGSLQLNPATGSIKVGIEQLAKETDLVVSAIIKAQVKSPYSDVPNKSGLKKPKGTAMKLDNQNEHNFEW